ncbi:MAG: SAM-dependent methyltransferase [Segetibacter sp.]|nr:SAM-dependent methyltransferase [Segetibacter sp.]
MINKTQRVISFLSKGYNNNSSSASKVPFTIQLNGHPKQLIGNGEPGFNLVFKNKNSVNALTSMDDTKIIEAYMAGDIDIEGDLLKTFELRGMFRDFHPLQYLWCFIHPLIFGQVASDRKWIAEHYDLEQDFYLTFLDSRHRCYSQGVFEYDNEALEDAITRKLDYALQATLLQPGQHVLDIGGGWGSFVEYAGQRGIRVTSLTLSKESEMFINNIIKKDTLPCQVVRQHLFEHNPEVKYDAIVNLGVTEHLTNYGLTIKKYQSLVKPGGRIYLDASGSRTKFGFHSFIYRYIYPGNYSPVCLHEYLQKLSLTNMQLVEVINDRHNYYLTTKCWAENLDSNRNVIISRWGEFLYRKFQVYLWGCVDVFNKDIMQAYRWVLEAKK